MCVNFVLCSLESSTQLYSHYRIAEENSAKHLASFAFRFYQIQFRPWLRPGPHWESLRRSPKPPSRLGGGHHLPIPRPLDAFGVSPTVPNHFSKPSAAHDASDVSYATLTYVSVFISFVIHGIRPATANHIAAYKSLLRDQLSDDVHSMLLCLGMLYCTEPKNKKWKTEKN